MVWRRISLNKLFSENRTEEAPEPVSPFFYAGTWVYQDNSTNRKHQFEIQPNYDVYLDKQLIKTQVESVTPSRLILIDNFGFKIVIRTNGRSPISIFDEANDETYAIIDSL
ncbi:DUF4828 domain-containing protein [Pediococcus claussenii]|nr:DUF4828 domain-containing protein [Pediococcus claussenii]KRN20285.1 hypothetical protein IV79_GL000954 [Pediococcus claussenii]